MSKAQSHERSRTRIAVPLRLIASLCGFACLIAEASPDDNQVRDACPVGMNFRYSDEQILYHYTKNRQVLKDAVAEAQHTLARIGG